jgi:hypothetical protein
MAKANIQLPNGTTVVIDGTIEEIEKILHIYGQPTEPPKPPPARKKSNAKATLVSPNQIPKPEDSIDYAQIVNLVKTCEEAEAIEKQILNRDSQVDRTLLPLYIVYEYLDNAFALTSGEIGKITTDLGIPISQPNASRTLTGTASRYVIGDKIKKKGQAVRYKLHRRGVDYMKSVIGGAGNEN